MWYRKIAFEISDDDFIRLILSFIHSREHCREQYCFYVDFDDEWAEQCLQDSAVIERFVSRLQDNSELVFRDESD